jgi:poly(3-hydroxybutyrate) depolymerase
MPSDLETAAPSMLRPIDLATGDQASHQVLQQHPAVRQLNSFGTLLRNAGHHTGPSSTRALVVMPLSGHHPVLIRDLILELSNDLPIDVLDWNDAREIPATFGNFGFDDQIQTIYEAVASTNDDLHLIGVCQSALPCLIAAALIGRSSMADKLFSLSLLGGPIVPSANPTALSRAIMSTPLWWLEMFVLERLSNNFQGRMRSVYSAATQRSRICKYLQRQHLHCGRVSHKVAHDDGLNANVFPFLKSLTHIKDLPGEFFIENLARAYHAPRDIHALLVFRGQALPETLLDKIPILVLEGEVDDIVAPGQTAAVFRLFNNRPIGLDRSVVIDEACHFDLFHGHICRQKVAHELLAFFHNATSQRKNRNDNKNQ